MNKPSKINENFSWKALISSAAFIQKKKADYLKAF